jgi:lipopolysaccharide/colanic/teichoic acid biosynthesis glycosyltransferase
MSTCTSDTESFPVDDLGVLNHSIHPSTVSTIKRLIDIFGAIIGLMITAVVAIPVAIANKIDSPGPILYSQFAAVLTENPSACGNFAQ